MITSRSAGCIFPSLNREKFVFARLSRYVEFGEGHRKGTIRKIAGTNIEMKRDIILVKERKG